MKLTEEIKEKLDFNEQFKFALNLLENSNKNIFITGKAGTGKSTLLQYFRSNSAKNVVVLAPTGVAAVNIKGQTIHSFFKFRPDITPDSVAEIRIRRKSRELYKKLDTVVIDEISMVRSDLLDCIDKFLRIYGKCPGIAFGGVQMVLFGDLYQLPPVVTDRERELFKGVYNGPYFFNAKVYNDVLGKEGHPQKINMVELKKIYRQKELGFIELLNTIRNKSVTQDRLDHLNSRFKPDFVPRLDEFYIYLTTTNAMADKINESRLKHLASENFTIEGDVMGDFEKKNLPTHQVLNIKCGAQVMLLNNEANGRWVNGSIGRVVSIEPQREIISVELSSGEVVDVTMFTWEMYSFFYNKETEKLESESIGSFMQFPLKLAWAVTIHKSQGKTFSKVIVDIGSGTFSSGQIYVALSRCTSFDGLVLKKKIRHDHILLDNRIEEFMNNIVMVN